MQYTIRSTKQINLKSGKTKWDVDTDKGQFQTWDSSIGNAPSGTVIEATADKSSWKDRSGNWHEDMMLKLVGEVSRGAGQAGGAAAVRAPSSDADRNIAVACAATQIAYSLMTSAEIPKGADLAAMAKEQAMRIAEVIKSVAKEIGVPPWLKALKASGLVTEVKSVGLVAADVEAMFTAAQGNAEAFLSAVKSTIQQRKQPATTEPEKDDDLPF